MSGDLDPDKTIAIIDEYFGQMKPNPELPKLNLPKEEPITEPIIREVLGPDAESVALAWRFPGASSKDFETLQVISQLLYNGKAGLIDLDLNQQQKVLNGYGYPMGLADYSMFILGGVPKQGQTLEEVQNLLLGELHKLRAGDFDEKCCKPISTTSSFIKYRIWKAMKVAQICSSIHLLMEPPGKMKSLPLIV